MALEFLTPDKVIHFDIYLQHLYVSIREKWIADMPKSVALGTEGVVVIEFEVKKAGDLAQSSLKIRKQFGNADLGKHAKSAIHNAAPFDPLPEWRSVVWQSIYG